MTDVSIVRCEEYELEGCTQALLTALEPFGGLDWVREGMRIVIKANLVEAMKPEKAGTTHPVLLTALTPAKLRRNHLGSRSGVVRRACLKMLVSLSGWVDRSAPSTLMASGPISRLP